MTSVDPVLTAEVNTWRLATWIVAHRDDQLPVGQWRQIAVDLAEGTLIAEPQNEEADG